MPELGCTSAVQNEKIHFFIFVLLVQPILAPNVFLQAKAGARVGITNQGSIPLSWQYIYSWYSCICKSRHRAPSLQMPTRGRVAPKLACVQDIRPHVPELGCTSAVQNEKIHFSFCTASATRARNILKNRARPTSALPSQVRCLEVGNT